MLLCSQQHHQAFILNYLHYSINTLGLITNFSTLTILVIRPMTDTEQDRETTYLLQDSRAQDFHITLVFVNNGVADLSCLTRFSKARLIIFAFNFQDNAF